LTDGNFSDSLVPVSKKHNNPKHPRWNGGSSKVHEKIAKRRILDQKAAALNPAWKYATDNRTA
jgi:hypothetical protein